MNQTVRKIFEQAQVLSAEDRDALGEMLLATVDPGSDFDTVWSDEAARRWNEHEQSRATAVDAFQAVEEVRAALKRPANNA